MLYSAKSLFRRPLPIRRSPRTSTSGEVNSEAVPAAGLQSDFVLSNHKSESAELILHYNIQTVESELWLPVDFPV